MGRGIHSKPNNGLSNDWITPKDLIESLGSFDLDPCANSTMPWRTARRMIAPPKDGMAARWNGSVWLNPPYGSQIRKWIRRLSEHGNGIALVPSRTEVEKWFWPFVWEKAQAVFFFRGRLYFRRPDGSKEGNAGHGSILAVYGEQNIRRVIDSKLPGRLFVL